MLGDGGVGKTALRLRFMGHGFQSSYLSTIGADFALKEVILENKESIKMQIWDLAGQVHYSKIRTNYYIGAHGAFIVYDVVRPDSFENITNWILEVKKNLNKPIPIVLIANKIDLRNQFDQAVSKNDGQKLKEKLEKEYENKVYYVETSAFTGAGVDEAFHLLVKELSANYQ